MTETDKLIERLEGIPRNGYSDLIDLAASTLQEQQAELEAESKLRRRADEVVRTERERAESWEQAAITTGDALDDAEATIQGYRDA